MSLVSGAVSGSRDMGGDDENASRTVPSHHHDTTDDEAVGSLGRQMSESSLCATEEEEDDDSKLQLGPQYTIKEHLEKDKVLPCLCSFTFLYIILKKDNKILMNPLDFRRIWFTFLGFRMMRA